jgi:4-hydroxy-tetrahydrodipicolinate synthase
VDRDELKRLIVGGIATVPTPFDDDFRVDYGKVGGLTRWWVENGLVTGKSVIKVAAFIGEGPQLADEEWANLILTTVQAAEGRVPVMAGVHSKDTVRTIDDAKRAADLGAVALQLTSPIFNDPNDDDKLRYFEAVNNAVDIGMMIYNVKWQRGDNFYGVVFPDTIRKMIDFENLAAIKWSPQAGSSYEDVFDLKDTFNIIDNTGSPVRNHRLGGKGFVNMTAPVNPQHIVGIWDLMEAGKYDQAQANWDSIEPTLRDFYRRVTARSGGQARVLKAMMKVIDKPVGDCRPPSMPLLREEQEELRRIMQGWGWV